MLLWLLGSCCLKRGGIDMAPRAGPFARMPDQAAVGAIMAASFSTKLPVSFLASNRSMPRSFCMECQKGLFGINVLPRRLLLPRSRLQSFANVFLSDKHQLL